MQSIKRLWRKAFIGDTIQIMYVRPHLNIPQTDHKQFKITLKTPELLNESLSINFIPKPQQAFKKLHLSTKMKRIPVLHIHWNRGIYIPIFFSRIYNLSCVKVEKQPKIYSLCDYSKINNYFIFWIIGVFGIKFSLNDGVSEISDFYKKDLYIRPISMLFIFK